MHGISAVYLEWARWAHLDRSVSQSEHWIRFILTKGTVSDIIKTVILSGWRRALLINPLHPSISMQILLTVLCTYPIVLSRGIDLSIKGSFTY